MPVSTALRDRVVSLFTEHFGKPDIIVRSPGRINLIGEHTDYNLGYVLPAAIDKAICIAIQKRDDSTIQLLAADLGESFTGNVVNLVPSGMHWPDYLLGVTDQLRRNGHAITGFNAVVGGDVPLGAGLSSSAAVECAMAFALNELFALALDKKTMVLTAQKAENQFVGLQCGIMDMFASMFGASDKLIQLDCRSLVYDYIPFPADAVDIVLLDTGVKHSLASSEYNLRREECERGVAIIAQRYPHVLSLRDATSAMVDECLENGNATVYRRCRYVTDEIQRVMDGCEDLSRGDLPSFGKRMFATHKGLSEQYEVSCPEADALVNMAASHAHVLGARMMGGGFGGCTINLVKPGHGANLAEAFAPAYKTMFGRELKSYQVRIDKGTSLV